MKTVLKANVSPPFEHTCFGLVNKGNAISFGKDAVIRKLHIPNKLSTTNSNKIDHVYLPIPYCKQAPNNIRAIL